MNEQQQAELLATWLADPNARIPRELDAEVVESVLALHPEKAPAPRVSAGSILALVESGPLAPPQMPNAVVDPPQPPAPANRPWALLIGLLGGSGAVVAALTMLTVGVVVSQNIEHTSVENPQQITSRSPQRDTGLGAPSPTKARKALPKGRSRPAPKRLVVGRPTQQKILEQAARAEPAEPAVAGLDDFEDAITFEAEEDVDLDAGRIHTRHAGGGSALAEDSEEASEKARATFEEAKRSAAESAQEAIEEERRSADEARRQAEEAQARRQDEGAQAQAERAASRGWADEAPADGAEPALKQEQVSRRPGRRNKLKKDRRPRPAREPIAEMPAAAPAAGAPPPPPISPYAGTTGVSDPQVTIAQQALAAGDAATAIAAANTGLQRHPGDTRVRQLLYAILGDAYTTRGNTTAANQAYAEATRIAYSLR